MVWFFKKFNDETFKRHLLEQSLIKTRLGTMLGTTLKSLNTKLQLRKFKESMENIEESHSQQ